MTSRPPLDPRRRAFAEALGHLLAEVVWCEICGETSETPRPARPANLSGAVVEAENGEDQPHAEP